VTGTAGGSRIIATVVQIVVDVFDYTMDIAAAVAAPRVHHQWMPDEVRWNAAFRRRRSMNCGPRVIR
jgi:gamma-glutamyltranspeptidase / glutathione hydrolase